MDSCELVHHHSRELVRQWWRRSVTLTAIIAIVCVVVFIEAVCILSRLASLR